MWVSCPQLVIERLSGEDTDGEKRESRSKERNKNERKLMDEKRNYPDKKTDRDKTREKK
jgi:hypothetical protein